MLNYAAQRVTFWLLFSLLLVGIAPLLRRGGRPRAKPGSIIFPLRPGMKIVSIIMLILATALVLQVRHSDTVLEAFFFSGVGLLMGLAGAYCLTTQYSVDESGIHFHRLGRTKTIVWDELDHYERLSIAQYGSQQTLFRSKDGRTIGIDELGQNGAVLLAEVLSRCPVRERPYVKAHWWGG